MYIVKPYKSNSKTVIHNIDGTDTKQPNSNSADMFVDTFNLISNEVIIKVIKPIKYDTYPVFDKIRENCSNEIIIYLLGHFHIFFIYLLQLLHVREGFKMSEIFPMHKKIKSLTLRITTQHLTYTAINIL